MNEMHFSEPAGSEQQQKELKNDENGAVPNKLKVYSVSAVEAFRLIASYHFADEKIPQDQIKKLKKKAHPLTVKFFFEMSRDRLRFVDHVSDYLLLAQAERMDAGGQLPVDFKAAFLHKTMLMKMEESQKDGISYSPNQEPDQLSSDNICFESLNKLKETTILMLRTNKVNEDKIVWLRIVEKSIQMGHATVILATNSDRTQISLYLYNMYDCDVALQEVDKDFPVGMRFGLKNPYTTFDTMGYLFLRCDQPCNIVRNTEAFTKSGKRGNAKGTKVGAESY